MIRRTALIERCRKVSRCIYIACDERAADDIAGTLKVVIESLELANSEIADLLSACQSALAMLNNPRNPNPDTDEANALEFILIAAIQKATAV